MREGVTIVDPATTYIDAEAELAADTRLWPGTIIQGAAKIAGGCEIGPYAVIENAVVKAARAWARLRVYGRVR